jgi:hypothetical protein
MQLLYEHFTINRYRAFEIESPYLSFGIKVVVQQLETFFNTTTKKKDKTWKPIGETTIGPKLIGNIIKDNQKSDSPQVHVLTYYTLRALCLFHLLTGDCQVEWRFCSNY